MLYRDCIENLLQLKDVIVTNIECHDQEMHIWLRMEQRIHHCPRCGTATSKVHDYRLQLVRDVSISGYKTILHLRKRRHVCPVCGKRFDEHIDFLLEKYTELYRENDELERKLKIVVTNLDEIRDEEESIRATLVKAQQLGEKIVREANEKADAITDSIKTRCEAIITDFRKQYSAERKEVWQLRNTVLDFKKNVYELYRDHIEELQSISVNELEQLVIPEDTEVVGRILSDVKEAVQTQVDAGEDIKREQDLNVTEPVTQETDFIMDEEETKAADAYTTEEDDGLDFIDKLDKVDKDS